MKRGSRAGARLLLFGALGWAAGCAPGAREAPDSLHGVWVTDAGRYAGRSMVITADTVRFEVGGKRFTAHRIERVEEFGGERIDLSYESHGATYRLALVQRPDRSLALANQPSVVWRRSSESPGGSVR